MKIIVDFNEKFGTVTIQSEDANATMDTVTNALAMALKALSCHKGVEDPRNAIDPHMYDDYDDDDLYAEEAEEDNDDFDLEALEEKHRALKERCEALRERCENLLLKSLDDLLNS